MFHGYIYIVKCQLEEKVYGKVNSKEGFVDWINNGKILSDIQGVLENDGNTFRV